MLLALSSVTLAFAPASAAPTETVTPEPRRYAAVRAVDEIVIDGRADERTWALAPTDDRFRERTPNLGQDAPLRTWFKVAYDDQYLYVFIDCESKPGDVTVRTLRRDNTGIFSDDTVYVKIDPTHNRRSAYSFGVNADGAQIDILGLEDGRDFITEWDSVWSAETVRREDGYSVEYRIPFAVLGIKRAEVTTMGLDFSRDVPSDNSTYDWRLFVPPRSAMAASQFGTLEGLENIRAGRAVEVTPYALAQTNFAPSFSADPTRRPNLATGADMRVQLGANSYAEGTLLTDFAQVEADAVQVARNRFPLFFPERRPFFINGLEVFNFGRRSEAQLFFTRRIGLQGGSPVPILGGAKVYGRSGVLQYGVLQVQTLGASEDPDRGVQPSSPESFTVGRVRVQATRALNVGMLLLGRHRIGSTGHDDAAGGVDAQLIGLDGRLQAYAFMAGTWAEQADDDAPPPGEPPLPDPPVPPAEIGSSAYAAVEYRGLYVRPSVSWLWSDEDFDPRLGFYRRTNATRQQASLIFAPRPKAPSIREVNVGPTVSLETTPEYDARLGQDISAYAQLDWANGANVGNSFAYFLDVVQAEFDLYGHGIEAADYTGFRNQTYAGLPSRRAVGGNLSYEFIELFGGAAHQPSASTTLRLGKHFTLGAAYTHIVGRFRDEGETFDFGFANGNVDVAITRNLAFDTLLRLDLSPGSERVGLQSRLRWRFLPGSDIFLVYRNNLPVGSTVTADPFHAVTLKVAYYIRSFIG
ncbi:MAG: DUF5916 domain-containing protein [Nannocystaceae bacterium]|nr:carbohydrate binding family 9 domain-containing protein [bacterium]